jgi:hypothetical protein
LAGRKGLPFASGFDQLPRKFYSSAVLKVISCFPLIRSRSAFNLSPGSFSEYVSRSEGEGGKIHTKMNESVRFCVSNPDPHYIYCPIRLIPDPATFKDFYGAPKFTVTTEFSENKTEKHASAS